MSKQIKITKSFPNTPDADSPMIYTWQSNILTVIVSEKRHIKVEGVETLQEALAIFKTINQQ